MSTFKKAHMSKNSTPDPSIPKLLEEMWEKGFFSKKQKREEVAEELGREGYNFPTPTLTKALNRKSSPSGFLTKGIDGYIQKRPFSRIQSRQKQKGTSAINTSQLHSVVGKASLRQLNSGHYKEAIQNAFVEVIEQVKKKTNYPKNRSGRELDGDDLMNRVFGCDGNSKPIIAFNSLRRSLDKAEQRGIMYLFKGIVGIRDKKAHLNFTQNDPQKTLEYLSLASLLMRLLDEGEIDESQIL